MKTLLKLSGIATVIILIAIGCKKIMSDEHSMNDNVMMEFNTAFVKEWYYGTFMKSDEYLNYDQKENGKKLPDWKNGKFFSIGEIQIVEFPLKVSKKKIGISNEESKVNARRIVEAAVKKIVFIKNKDNSITIKEMLYVPEYNYLKSKNYDISDLSIKDYSKSFKGTIRSFNWNGKFENGFIYTNNRNYRLKAEIKLNNKMNNSIANRDCGGVLETWFEYECNSDYSGDVFDENNCLVMDIIDQTYTPFDCGPEIENCNEQHCMCANYGIGCDFTVNTNPDENDCGNITNEEGREKLNSLVGEELSDISYIRGGETPRDAFGVIRSAVQPQWAFYSLDFGMGYKPKWVAFFSGIIYKRKTSDLWKWESIKYVTTDKDAPIPPCFSTEMKSKVADPIISLNKLLATTAVRYTVTITIPCLASVEVDVKTGAIPYNEILAKEY